jgi:hypothetical protein
VKGRAALALVAVLALTLAACGDDNGDGGGGEGSVTTETGVGGEAGEFDVVEADQQVAEAALLSLDDFDDLWVAGEFSDEADPVDVEIMTGIEGCQSEAERVLEVAGQRTAFARSDFSRSADGAEVRSAAAIYVDDATAQEAVEVSFSDCSTAAAEQGFEQSPEFSGVTVGQPESAEFGDEARVFRVEATAQDPESGTPMELIVDLVRVRTGRGSASFIFAHPVTVDPPLVQTGAALVETVVGRLAAELE